MAIHPGNAGHGGSVTGVGRRGRAGVHRALTVAANLGRRIPFIILMVALIPVTRWIVGTSIGTAASIVPLVIGAIPYAAHLVRSALLEVDRGLAMGATAWQVLTKVYLPEALPQLSRAATLMAVT